MYMLGIMAYELLTGRQVVTKMIICSRRYSRALAVLPPVQTHSSPLACRRPYKESVPKATIKYIQKCLEVNKLDEDLPETYTPEAPDSKYNLSSECLSCLKGLLEPRPWKRLSTQNFEDAFMKHPWFADFDWESAQKRDKVKLPAPVHPKGGSN